MASMEIQIWNRRKKRKKRRRRRRRKSGGKSNLIMLDKNMKVWFVY